MVKGGGRGGGNGDKCNLFRGGVSATNGNNSAMFNCAITPGMDVGSDIYFKDNKIYSSSLSTSKEGKEHSIDISKCVLGKSGTLMKDKAWGHNTDSNIYMAEWDCTEKGDGGVDVNIDVGGVISTLDAAKTECVLRMGHNLADYAIVEGKSKKCFVKGVWQESPECPNKIEFFPALWDCTTGATSAKLKSSVSGSRKNDGTRGRVGEGQAGVQTGGPFGDPVCSTSNNNSFNIDSCPTADKKGYKVDRIGYLINQPEMKAGTELSSGNQREAERECGDKCIGRNSKFFELGRQDGKYHCKCSSAVPSGSDYSVTMEEKHKTLNYNNDWKTETDNTKYNSIFYEINKPAVANTNNCETSSGWNYKVGEELGPNKCSPTTPAADTAAPASGFTTREGLDGFDTFKHKERGIDGKTTDSPIYTYKQAMDICDKEHECMGVVELLTTDTSQVVISISGEELGKQQKWDIVDLPLDKYGKPNKNNPLCAKILNEMTEVGVIKVIVYVKGEKRVLNKSGDLEDVSTPDLHTAYRDKEYKEKPSWKAVKSSFFTNKPCDVISWYEKRSYASMDKDRVEKEDVIKDEIANSTCDWDKIPTSKMEGKVDEYLNKMTKTLASMSGEFFDYYADECKSDNECASDLPDYENSGSGAGNGATGSSSSSTNNGAVTRKKVCEELCTGGGQVSLCNQKINRSFRDLSGDTEMCTKNGVKKTYKDWEELYNEMKTRVTTDTTDNTGATASDAVSEEAVGPTTTTEVFASRRREGLVADNKKCERSKCDYSSWGEVADIKFFGEDEDGVQSTCIPPVCGTGNMGIFGGQEQDLDDGTKSTVIPCGWNGNCYGDIITDDIGDKATNPEFNKKFKRCRGVGKGLLKNKDDNCPIWKVYKDGSIKPDKSYKMTDERKTDINNVLKQVASKNSSLGRLGNLISDNNYLGDVNNFSRGDLTNSYQDDYLDDIDNYEYDKTNTIDNPEDDTRDDSNDPNDSKKGRIPTAYNAVWNLF